LSPELASLKTLLEIIAEDTVDIKSLPETFPKQIAGMLSNSQAVFAEVQRLAEKYSGLRVIRGSK
jgi:hypothetical protein